MVLRAGLDEPQHDFLSCQRDPQGDDDLVIRKPSPSMIIARMSWLPKFYLRNSFRRGFDEFLENTALFDPERLGDRQRRLVIFAITESVDHSYEYRLVNPTRILKFPVGRQEKLLVVRYIPDTWETQ